MLAPAPEADTTFRRLGFLEYLYGEIWTRPTLCRRERRIISLCCAASVDHDTDAHAYAALKSGDLSYAELQEVVLHFATYQGWHRGARFDDTVVSAWARVQTEADGS